jgi:hypothetical protein
VSRPFSGFRKIRGHYALYFPVQQRRHCIQIRLHAFHIKLKREFYKWIRKLHGGRLREVEDNIQQPPL